MSTLRLSVSLTLAAALLTGCGGGDDAGTDPAGGSDSDVVITIVDFDYDIAGPVEPGSEVIVVNQDEVGHTVTSDEEGLFDVTVAPGQEVSFTAPDEAGEYPFFCIPHPDMVATLVVE